MSDSSAGETRTDLVRAICARFGNDPLRLLDVARAVQIELRSVDDETVAVIADALGLTRSHVAGTSTFYAFLSRRPLGRVVIRLDNDVISRMKGAAEVAAALEDELGIGFGDSTADGRFTLEYTSCIGMADQAPAALVNGLVMPRLRPGKARRGIEILRENEDWSDLQRLLVRTYGDGNNAHDLVRSAVHNNLREPGQVIFGEMPPGAALEKALAGSPVEIIRQIKTSRLRGRGGAGFPTGLKWEFTRSAPAGPGGDRYLICNADEGEPGTFKDRVILTERPDLLFEGMTVGAYAIGAAAGIVYLRSEYGYLRRFLEHVLERRRERGLLGSSILGRAGFDFDIRIQMGAGAYVCGEETALISSCEGHPGVPRTRPPFPAQRGYLDSPTSVNNVETLCCVARIAEMGSGWFAAFGTQKSTGTKLLSIAGDCRRPGVYEVPFGISLTRVFELCGAEDPMAAQVGGPSGRMVGPDAFARTICFDDLPTGGSLMVFNDTRDPVEITAQFMEFFVHESCGFCTPCRVGTVLLQERLQSILDGRGEPADIDRLEALAQTVKVASRCGLGQTAPHPLLSTLESFRPAYEARLREPVRRRRPTFDLDTALVEARRLTGPRPAPVGRES